MLKFPIAALLLFGAAPALAQVTVDAQDVGEIYQTTSGHSTILFTNGGADPVKIFGVTPLDGRDSVGEFKLPSIVAPKTSANIPVTVFSGMDAGDRRHYFVVRTDLPKRPDLQVAAHLFALSVLDDATPKVDLGTLDTKQTPEAKAIVLSSREVPDFHVTRVLETPDFAAAKILPDGHTLSVLAKADADWGRHEGYVKVALNSTLQPQAWISVSADVHGEVVPSQNPVDMGMFRSTNVPVVVQLKSRDGTAPKLGAMSIEGINAVLTTQPCVGGGKGCVQLSIKVASDQPRGRMQGQLLVELPAYHRTLPIRVAGFYLPADVKVESLNELQAKAAKASKEPPPLDLKSALKQSTQAVTASALVDPPGNGPLLKWQVSNENNIYGYLVYRGDDESGPFLRVDKDIVRVEGEAGDGHTHSYAWRDTSATLGKTYWYYIGMLNRDGSKKQLSGPQKVVAK